MENDGFLELIQRNPVVVELLERLPLLGLPDAWVVSGCLFQTAWNVLSNKPSTYGIRDYDIFYFDASDLSAKSEEAINLAGAELFTDVGCDIDIRNQARVHTWYEAEFGVGGYPQLTRSTDGIDNFLAVCCMVAIRRTEDGAFDVYSPFGVDDVLDRVMRPNPWYPNAPADFYNKKARRWTSLWPELKVEPLKSSHHA